MTRAQFDRWPLSHDGAGADDRLHEECGIFGIFNHPHAAQLTAIGLHALQHRGQEACGIVSYDGGQFFAERHVGLVGENFDRPDVVARLKGDSAIGHVRYSTMGESSLRNVQPLFADLDTGGLAIGHNGNLTNALQLRRRLVEDGAICQSTSDTEVFLHLTARSRKPRLIERFIDSLRQVEGAFALVALADGRLIGARDALGIRPLVLGRLGDAHVLASETCALDIVGARFEREIVNGEVVEITRDGLKLHRAFTPRPARPCVFEFIYFSRPDSIIGGRTVYDMRKALGRELAREAPANADVVIPIPDSGVPAALGFAQESRLPYEMGIIRNHYVGRTFILPEQAKRQLGVKMKHSANVGCVRGKRIVLIDDSVVRGTTSVKIVEMMRDAGAREVHMRIACPPITHPDFYGIDTPEQHQLLAATHDLEAMRTFMGADSLAFISIGGLYRALGHERRDAKTPQFTDHCFTGEYPTPLTDRAEADASPQLSLLAEAS